MTIQRHRSVADMPLPWREPDDPQNLRVVAQMMELYQKLRGPRPAPEPRVRKFRNVQEMEAAQIDERADPRREASPDPPSAGDPCPDSDEPNAASRG